MDNARFTPVRGLEENILATRYTDGQVYFAIDTKTIYMDADGQNKIPMGSGSGSGTSGSGIIFGEREITAEEEAETTISFRLDQLNIDYTPAVDAVIFNTKDGCFYRVTEVISADNIEALRLTVAGGGSGGGGQDTVHLTLDIISGINTGSTFVYGQSANVVFKGNVDNGDTVMIYQIEVINTYATKTTSKKYGPFQGAAGAEYTYDLGSVLPLGTNTVKFSVSSDNAGMTKVVSKTLINCVEMKLEASDDFNPIKFNNGAFNFYCIPVGTDLTKKIEIFIDGVLEPTLTKANIIDSGVQKSFAIPALAHGAHTIKAVLTCAESTAQTSLEYNVCCVQAGVTTPIIWHNTSVPSSIINHDVLTIEYMVYNPESTQNVETHYYINGAEIATSPAEVSYSQTAWLKWRVIGYTLGVNTLTLKTGTTEDQISVEVKVDTKRNLDIVTAGLHVNLSAIGRSNSENTQSRQTWSSQSLFDDTVTNVSFNNFNWYNNGWINDDDGETCLRISNGASISVPLSGVLNTRSLREALAFEFVFKVRNVGHYGTLINTEVSDTDADTATVTKTVSSTEGVWGSFYKNSIGFCLGTQEAFFKTKNALVSGRFKEDEKVHLTFVIENAGANSNRNKLLYIYINGVNSGISKYNTTTDSLAAGCQALTINSDYCDVDLYNFRVYRTNLTAQFVIQNYLADYNDAALYDMNENIVTYNNGVPTIQYLKMLEYNDQQAQANNPEGLLMPYMLVETVSNDDQMPYYKAEQDAPWKVNITFVNPQSDYYFENNLIDDNMLTNYGKSSPDELYALNAPSFSCNGAEINVQGTSSQGYPVRNFKIKMKKSTNWNYKLLKDADDKVISVSKGGTTKNGYKVGKKYHTVCPIGETSYTIKADYMDSSSVHNSGFANLVGTMYSKHPIEDYGFDASEAAKHRTSVYGFPYLMFQKLHTGTGDAQYKFLGRYNFNVDKGADDTFGFCDYGDDSYVDVTSLVNASNYDAEKLYIADGTDYICVAETVEEGAELPPYDSTETYYRFDEGADSNALNPDYDATDPYSRHYLPWSAAAECWEMQNNQGGRCSFSKADFTDLSDTGVISVLNDYEYRYHIDGDSIDNCLARDHYKTDGIDFSGATNEQVNTYMLKKLARFEKLVTWLASTDSTKATGNNLESPVTYDGTQYTKDTANYRLAKFKAEFNLWLDKEYCMIYWIMTELLLCYDSRGKNLMMATWGPHTKGGNDIWYPIFYDIDTQLGVNNSGVPYWDYYEEATDNGTYSTADSVLWNNLWKVFSSDIMAKFNALTGNQLTIDKINGAYSFDPMINANMAMSGQRPIITINVDEYQKYIAPSISGYINTANQNVISDAFYYCLQGTRDLQRQMFLRNRFNYISSKWQGGDYSIAKAKQGVQMRFDANDYPNTSDKYLNTNNPLMFFSKPETVAKVGKIAIINQDTYNRVKDATYDGYIYIKNTEGTYDPDLSFEYDGSKASSYYVKNDYVYSAYPHPLDFVWDFNVTPYLKQYVSNIWDDTALPTTYASDGETVTIPLPANQFDTVMNTPNYPQQLIYFGGAEYLSSLGDLSKKYPDQLWISGAHRLKDLLIGSDVEGYWNKMMNSDSFKPDDTATITVDGVTKTNPNAKTLLEKVILTNLQGLTNTIDFSGSEKLKELRALGTNVSSFVLADGVQIAKLHLPATITNLILKEPTSLTGILTSSSPSEEQVITYSVTTVTEDTYDVSLHYINTIDGYKRCDDAEYFMSNEVKADYPDFDEDEGLAFNSTRTYYLKNITTENVYPNGLYIEGLTNLQTIDTNSRTNLETIDIVGGNMGYDSYKLLEKTVDIKEKMIAHTEITDGDYNKHLYVNIENVKWTPYRQIAEGEIPETGKTYVLKDDHDIFQPYTQVSNEYPNWDLNTANGLIYEYDSILDAAHQNDIVDIDTLDTFIEDYQEAKDVYDALVDKNNFDSENYNFFKSNDRYAMGPTLANLTGTIYINNTQATAIEESKIKNYYQDKYYPKLNIQVKYIDKCYVTKFVEVTNDETGKEYVWDTLKYPKTGEGSRTYPEFTTKVASKLNYDFKGWTATKYTQAQVDAMTDAQAQAILLTNETIQDLLFADAEDNVIKLYAVYRIHSYDITYKYNNGTVIEVVKVPSSQYIDTPSVVPYQDDSALDFDKTYSLVGYARVKDAAPNEVVALNPDNSLQLNIKSTQDLTLYAVFKEDSVYNNVVDTSYLVFEDVSTIESQGYGVGLNSDYYLRGKITLPVSYTDPNTNITMPVTKILTNGFKGASGSGSTADKYHEITHIFWSNSAQCQLNEIQSNGFQYCPTLKYVEMPEICQVVAGSNAFAYCTDLLKDITDEIAKKFFHGISYYRSMAFNRCSSITKVFIHYSIVSFGDNAFIRCTAINTIEFGDNEHMLALDNTIQQNAVFANVPGPTNVIYYGTDMNKVTDFMVNYSGMSNYTINQGF